MLKNVERYHNFWKDNCILIDEFMTPTESNNDMKSNKVCKERLENYINRFLNNFSIKSLLQISDNGAIKETSNDIVATPKMLLDWMAQCVKDKLDQKVSAEFMSYEEVEDIYDNLVIFEGKNPNLENIVTGNGRLFEVRGIEGEMRKEKLFKVSEIDNGIFISTDIDEVLRIEKEKFISYTSSYIEKELLKNHNPDYKPFLEYCVHNDFYPLKILLDAIETGYFPIMSWTRKLDRITNKSLIITISSSYKWNTNNKLSDELMFTIEVIVILLKCFMRESQIKNEYDIIRYGVEYGITLLNKLGHSSIDIFPSYQSLEYTISHNTLKWENVSAIKFNYDKIFTTTLAMLILNKIYPNREDDIINALKNINNKIEEYIEILADNFYMIQEHAYILQGHGNILSTFLEKVIPIMKTSAEIDEIVTIDTFKKFINN